MTSNSYWKKRFGWLFAGLGVFCLVAVAWLSVPEVPSPFPDGTTTETGESSKASSPSSTFIDAAPFLVGSRPFWRDTVVVGRCPELPARPLLVLPHYLPVAERIGRVLATWKACRQGTPIARVIVISPDHYQRLPSGSATLEGDGYSTPLGILRIDTGLRDALAKNGVGTEADLFIREHGAGLFPAFVAQHFPGVTYTPVVISRLATKDEVERIQSVVEDALESGDTLVIVTADFSHYLSKDQADAKDRESLRALTRRDADFFWSANDDYTDFGRGLWLGMRLAGPTSTFRVVDRMSSIDVGGSRAYTTSFFFGWWE